MSADWILGFDVGNTRVKAARLHGGGVEGFAWADQDDAAGLARLVESFDIGACLVAVASVRPDAAAILQQVIEDRGSRIDRLFRSDGSVFELGVLKHDLETPRTTGVDRVLACLAGLRRSPERPVIVVGCGTAITVNLATPDGVFRGGSILPGIRMQTEALHRGTAVLPDVSSFDGPPRPLGRSTRQAIASGVFHAAVGGIERLIAEFAALPLCEGLDPAVFLTDGDADFVSGRLRVSHQVEPYLVLEGLGEAVSRLDSIRDDS